MKSLSLGLALLLVAAAPAQAGDPAHTTAAHEAAAALPPPRPAAARRWIPDPPLAQGMRRLRAATAALGHGRRGHLDAAQVRAVAIELEAAVKEMFASCRLDPEPDAALHPLLVRVLAAARRLRAGEVDPVALAELEAVLARYPRLFDDPDWTATP